MTDLLQQITQAGIAFTVLCLFIWYLYNEKKKKDAEIKRLNDTIEALNNALRESEKDNLTAMYKLLGFMEKMDENRNYNHKEVIDKIHEFRQSLEDKLNSFS